MSGASAIVEKLSALSPRERVLITLAAALVIVVGLVYGGLMPGLSAARSAENRNVDATRDHAAAHALAAALATPKPMQVAQEELRASIEAAGLTLVEATPDQSGTRLRVRGSGPAAILAWIAAIADRSALNSALVEPDPSGGVVADIRLGGE